MSKDEVTLNITVGAVFWVALFLVLLVAKIVFVPFMPWLVVALPLMIMLTLIVTALVFILVVSKGG